MRWRTGHRSPEKWAHVLGSLTPNAAAKREAKVAIAWQLAGDLWRILPDEPRRRRWVGSAYLTRGDECARRTFEKHGEPKTG
jgi:hypothetical protein